MRIVLRFAGMLSGVDVGPELQDTSRLLSLDVEPGFLSREGNRVATPEGLEPSTSSLEVTRRRFWN